MPHLLLLHRLFPRRRLAKAVVLENHIVTANAISGIIHSLRRACTDILTNILLIRTILTRIPIRMCMPIRPLTLPISRAC
jgi:hypothetical protein